MAKKRHHSSHGKPMASDHSDMGIYSNRVERFDEKYAGPLQKRALERQDAMMINEDHHAMANLPQEPKMMYYSKNRYSTYDMDDTIQGIDKQQDSDQRGDVRRDAMRDGQY